MYQLMHRREEDFVLFRKVRVLEELYVLAQARTATRVLSPEMRHLLGEPLELHELRRCRSAASRWTSSVAPGAKGSEQYQDMRGLFQTKDNMSTQEELGPKAAKEVKAYLRQGALNPYGYDHCEYCVAAAEQPLLRRIKDRTMMFYKRVERYRERLCDSSEIVDYDYTGPMREFGYRCQLARDPSDARYVMEIMAPIRVAVGDEKVEQAAAKALQHQRPNSKLPRRRRQEAPRDPKILRAMQEEDLKTDSSMEGIDYQDIKSDGGDDEEEQPEEAQNDGNTPKENNKQATAAKKRKNFDKVLNKLKQGATPGEYYEQLQREKDKEEKEKKAREQPEEKKDEAGE